MINNKYNKQTVKNLKRIDLNKMFSKENAILIYECFVNKEQR